MVIGDPAVLIVPGWMGSGPRHWQTCWEQKHADYRRLALDDWHSVHREDWVQALETSTRSMRRDVVLVAHGLGCLTVAWWAASGSPNVGRILSAMLVAPPDLPSAPGCLPALSSFMPIPQGKLPFPSLLVASETDPYATIEAAAAMADVWGGTFLSAGRAGHINADSGHGGWPEGERYLDDFLDAVHITGYWRIGNGREATAGQQRVQGYRTKYLA